MYIEQIYAGMLQMDDQTQDDVIKQVNTMMDYVNFVSRIAFSKDDYEQRNIDRNQKHDSACKALDVIQKELDYVGIEFCPEFKLDKQAEYDGINAVYSRENHEKVAEIAATLAKEAFSIGSRDLVEYALDEVVQELSKNGDVKQLDLFTAESFEKMAENYQKDHQVIDLKDFVRKCKDFLEENNITDPVNIPLPLNNGGRLNLVFNTPFSDDFSVEIEPKESNAKALGRLSMYMNKQTKTYTDVSISEVRDICEKNGGALQISDKELTQIVNPKTNPFELATKEYQDLIRDAVMGKGDFSQDADYGYRNDEEIEDAYMDAVATALAQEKAQMIAQDLEVGKNK